MRFRIVQALGHKRDPCDPLQERVCLQLLHAWVEPEDNPHRLKTVDGQKVVAHQYSNYFESEDLEWDDLDQ